MRDPRPIAASPDTIAALGATGRPEKIVFSADGLPQELDDRARFNMWRDMYVAAYCEFDVMRLEDRPFSARTEYLHFGEIGVANTAANIERLVRNRQHVAAVPRSNFCLALSTSQSPIIQRQRDRETVHRPDDPVLVTEGEPGDISQPGGYSFFLLDIPPQLLTDRVAGASDLVATPLSAAPQATAHLRRYIETLSHLGGPAVDTMLAEHVAATLLDLVALILGAQGDSAELARARGLRAARLHDVILSIRNGFADPSFSPTRVSRGLGLSPRYVNELTQETGTSFADRVMELRLQKARTILADRRHDRLKVIDIAFDCGFNDVSYFNRCFRRRFGGSPTEFRGS